MELFLAVFPIGYRRNKSEADKPVFKSSLVLQITIYQEHFHHPCSYIFGPFLGNSPARGQIPWNGKKSIHLLFIPSSRVGPMMGP